MPVKVVCDHAHKECIKDSCYHSKPHDELTGLGQPCTQIRCNGTEQGHSRNAAVKCCEVHKNESKQ